MAAQNINWELGPKAQWRDITGGQPTKFSVFHSSDQKTLTIEPPSGQDYKPLTIQSDGTVDARKFTGDGSALKIDRETIRDVLAGKVDTTSFNTALNKKVDNQDFTAALAEKTDKQTFASELGKKVNIDKGQIKQEPWHAAKIHKDWKVVGGGSNPPAYFKDSMGIVHLRGNVMRVKPVSPPRGGYEPGYEAYPLFILDEGYRPQYMEIPNDFRIDPSGKILIIKFQNFFALDGFSFRAK
jgi:hypothetical protein